MPLEKLLGPILYVAPGDDDVWGFSVGVLIGGSNAAARAPVDVVFPAADVTVGRAVAAADFTSIGRGVFWRWPVQAPRLEAERWLSYRLDPRAGSAVTGVDPAAVFGEVAVPALGQLPRIAFFSCNGVLHWNPLENDLYELWSQVLTRHRHGGQAPDRDQPSGFHVLLGGGDQIYADVLWDERGDLQVPELVDYGSPSNTRIEREDVKYPASVLNRMRRAYVDLYVRRWSNRQRANPFADALATIPGVFVWDDHDIFDGWGSHPPKRQDTDLFRKTFTAAQEAYTAFQLGGSDRPNRVGVAGGADTLQAVRFSGGEQELTIVLPDLRTARHYDPDHTERNRVISEAQWQDLDTWLTGHASDTAPGRRHMLVVSSIPLVYLRFSALEERVVGFGPFDVDDDIRDQWSSTRLKGERNRLIMKLLAHRRRAGCEITVLAGDVHVAARAAITSRNTEHLHPGEQQGVIYQAVSSAILHPPPGAAEFFVARLAGDDAKESIGHLVEGAMQTIGEHRYLRTRNWLSIGFDHTTDADHQTRTRLWAQWNTARGPENDQLVVDSTRTTRI